MTSMCPSLTGLRFDLLLECTSSYLPRWVVGKDGNLQVGHGDSLRFCSAHSHENLAKSCFYAGHMEHA